MNKKGGTLISPLAVLREAIKAIPALKYALGVAGVAAAVALIHSFSSGSSIQVAIEIVGVLVFMTTLVVFARLSSLPHGQLRYPALVLGWFGVLFLITVSAVTLTSVAFHWPLTHLPWEQVVAPTVDLEKQTADLENWARMRIMSASPCIDDVDREGTKLQEAVTNLPALANNRQYRILSELHADARMNGQSAKDALHGLTSKPGQEDKSFWERRSTIHDYPGHPDRVLVDSDMSTGIQTDEFWVTKFTYYVNAYVDAYCTYASRVAANLGILEELSKQNTAAN